MHAKRQYRGSLEQVVSCVRSRNGWCALRDQRQTTYRDSMETRCGMFVTLPWGIERRTPDCEECRKAANAGAMRPARKETTE